jgi:hypothetical protein
MLSAATGLAAIVILLALIWVGQRRMIYFPFGDVPAPHEVSSSRVEEVRFRTVDGLELSAWFFPARGRAPRATILVFNGNAGNRAYRVPLAEALTERRMNVLLTDYRGYGGNPGVPTERGLADDSRAARAYLASRSDVDPARIVYFGESLGSAVAVDLAAEHPPAVLILRSPFTSMADIGQHHYPFLPVRLLLRDRFASIDRIRQIRSPLLVIAGGRDSIVPLRYSHRLYDGALEPKALVVLPDADHNDEALLSGAEMVDAVVRFIEQKVS